MMELWLHTVIPFTVGLPHNVFMCYNQHSILHALCGPILYWFFPRCCNGKIRLAFYMRPCLNKVGDRLNKQTRRLLSDLNVIVT